MKYKLSTKHSVRNHAALTHVYFRSKATIMEVAAHTLAEATRSAPFIDYAVCRDASSRPANHVGDWPMEGRIYAVRVVESRTEGIPLVHVLSFRGEAPYFNAFAPHRFEIFERLWLN